MLLSEDMGGQWGKLVTLWQDFEVKHEFREAGKLSPRGRPKCIADWIQRARSPAFRPDINPTYASEFSTWWTNLQPAWRTEGGGGELARGTGDLEGLRRPGVNGLLSVVAALFFWGVSLGKDREECGAWGTGVDEVAWVLSALGAAQ
jgi:hypothetical protein